jgi:hypothetical protein
MKRLFAHMPGVSAARPWRFEFTGPGGAVYGPMLPDATRAAYALEVYLRRTDERIDWTSYLTAEERAEVERAVDAMLAGATAQVSGYRG